MVEILKIHFKQNTSIYIYPYTDHLKYKWYTPHFQEIKKKLKPHSI